MAFPVSCLRRVFWLVVGISLSICGESFTLRAIGRRRNSYLFISQMKAGEDDTEISALAAAAEKSLEQALEELAREEDLLNIMMQRLADQKRGVEAAKSKVRVARKERTRAARLEAARAQKRKAADLMTSRAKQVANPSEERSTGWNMEEYVPDGLTKSEYAKN